MQEVVTEAAQIIRAGGLVVAPFDTVYGIIADPTSHSAINKINEIKGRPESKTIGLATYEIEQIGNAADLSAENSNFISQKIPGKFTFVLRANNANKISDLCKREGTIAVRVPDNELILKIAELSDGFVAQTSANKSGLPNCYSVDQISDQFDGLGQLDFVIDGGELPQSAPSELWDLTGSEPKKIERN
jgi:L-threonylcarbamoyladenylate synthase